MKLFTYEHCLFCVRARMIFGLKKTPFELAIIMEGDVETPTLMVGRKVVPILQKEDGSFMPESTADRRAAGRQHD
ncbi:glutathione S-transferase N-terminal domain-containing protein [Candidatus Symbiopectobacterium sp.]|uniref:glutathione S-transferase N-terminal domain-containing protein n=1 Tax=Candidatus Symbiopectobacterium sp. TaxID=2816440 RepID=UPI0025C02F2F|nr:glutathione S-transferase N-terminal domain-containing protein [Candidatus Symbiopectobacterium sp.]